MRRRILKKRDVFIWAVFFSLSIGFFLSQVYSERKINISVDKIGSELSAHIKGEIKKEDQMLFKKRYSLNPEEYEKAAYYGPVSNMNVEEILLVKARDSSQEDKLKQAMENRIEYQIANFDGYGTDQLAVLKNAKIICHDGYGLLIIAENVEELSNLYDELIGED